MCNYCGCRALEPVAQLAAEHDQILNLSRKIRRALDRGEHEMAAGLLRTLHDVLEGHDAVEELALYPAMARHPEFLKKVDTLFDEHDELDRVTRGALTAAERTGPSTADWAAVLTALEMLAEHIDHEEHGVFPAAAVSLDPADWEHAAAVRAQQTPPDELPHEQAVEHPHADRAGRAAHPARGGGLGGAADRCDERTDRDTRGSQAGSAVGMLRRWEDSGGVWRVLSRSAGRVDVVLLTCDAGQEMDRLTSTDPAVLDFIGLRSGSDEPPP